MNRVFSQIMINRVSRYLSEVHILQACVLIDTISLNRKIGRTMISIIQLLCNCQLLENVVRFYTICENKINGQSRRKRYIDS